MPRLVTLEVREAAAVLALDFVAPPALDDVLFALLVWAPDRVWVEIDLPREPNPCASGVLLLG